MIKLSGYLHKKVAVFGIGKTGASVIEALEHSGAEVFIWDDNEECLLETKKLYPHCHCVNPTGYNWSEIYELILSPGVSPHASSPHWVVKLANDNNCKITSDIELLLNHTNGAQVIGITGTNGKSTTTALVGHILKSAGFNSEFGGNIGVPALSLSAGNSAYVLELSSYQIDLLNDFNIRIAILLNITPDHIERYGNMENYVLAKKKLLLSSEISIINYDNPATRAIYDELKSLGKRVIPFSIKSKMPKGIALLEGRLYSNCVEHRLLGDLKLDLCSNAENILASYAVCDLLGIPGNKIIGFMRTFAGLQHRNEKIGKIGKVTFINDSKATNAASTENALLACTSYVNIYWIAGGISKSKGIMPLKPYFPFIKKAFLIGRAADLFAETLANQAEFVKCDNLESAFTTACQDAFKSDEESVVLLSPACASFDQWKNFEERGEAFCQLARAMIKCVENGTT